ncbi:MAG TPA: Uma2 family endonuclease [Rubricoccaceae bacterium]|jgi:Uma2 family endonuclease|nr:Uma2 family endonuclease [Rubricoccaceae bacterium]
MPTVAPPPVSDEPRERLFTVDEYYAMARAGILGPEDRVELIEGRIVAMSPIGHRHASSVSRLTRFFVRHADAFAVVWIQSPVRLSTRTEPEPDLALLVPKDAYAARHPRPEEVLLLIEVADTTLAYDRDTKLPLYAREGVREVWIVALPEERVHVYRRPTPEGYAEHAVFERGAALRAGALPEDVPPLPIEVALGP